MVQLSKEREAQLTEYAKRQGQESAAALDAIVADALEWEQREYRETVESIRRGYADLEAGRTRSLAEFFLELRGKHGLPR